MSVSRTGSIFCNLVKGREEEEKGDGMNTAAILEADVDLGSGVDAIEEIRLRTWARKNYAPATERDEGWHPVILDEMRRKDQED